MPEGLDLDAFVTGRAPSVDYATAITYGFGAYPEVRATFDWLREWNSSHPSRPPVSIEEVDCLGPAVGRDRERDPLRQRRVAVPRNNFV